MCPCKYLYVRVRACVRNILTRVRACVYVTVRLYAHTFACMVFTFKSRSVAVVPW